MTTSGFDAMDYIMGNRSDWSEIEDADEIRAEAKRLRDAGRDCTQADEEAAVNYWEDEIDGQISTCDHCGTRWYIDDLKAVGDATICEDCLEAFTRCHCCERYFDPQHVYMEEDRVGHEYCPECWEGMLEDRALEASIPYPGE